MSEDLANQFLYCLGRVVAAAVGVGDLQVTKLTFHAGSNRPQDDPFYQAKIVFVLSGVSHEFELITAPPTFFGATDCGTAAFTYFDESLVCFITRLETTLGDIRITSAPEIEAIPSGRLVYWLDVTLADGNGFKTVVSTSMVNKIMGVSYQMHRIATWCDTANRELAQNKYPLPPSKVLSAISTWLMAAVVTQEGGKFEPMKISWGVSVRVQLSAKRDHYGKIEFEVSRSEMPDPALSQAFTKAFELSF